MTMIERVARVIWDRGLGTRARQISYGNRDLQWQDAPDFSRSFYLATARAAIEAMREPTEAMVNAPDYEITTDGAVIGCWTAMIDAALSEKTA